MLVSVVLIARLAASFSVAQAADTPTTEPVAAEPAPNEMPAAEAQPTTPTSATQSSSTVGATPASTALPAGDAVSAPACVVPARPAKVLRIAVADVDASAAGDNSARLTSVFTSAVVAELRKLKGVSVVGMDEVRALLDHEATREATGCTDSSCMADLADALGADVLVVARLARFDDSEAVSFRRIDTASAKSTGVDRQFGDSAGEGMLSAIGPAVEQLFSEIPLLPGVERGVSEEAARRLNPPPVPAWAFWATTGTATALLAGGATAGLVTRVSNDGVNARVVESAQTPVPGTTIRKEFTVAENAALTANVLFAAGATVAVGAAVLALFTDFAGYGDE